MVNDYINQMEGAVSFEVILTGIFEDAWAVTQY
jgi:hypothetical protein